MDHGIREIDHLLTAVDDPQSAGSDFERLGFTVTPLSTIESVGVANRLVCFEPHGDDHAAFVELMGLIDPARTPPPLRAILQSGEGVRSLVMASADAFASREALVASGFDPLPVVHLQRQWRLPDGETLQVAFDVIPAPVHAPFPFNVCRYHTLAPYVREAFRTHPNGVRRFTGVYGVSASPREDAAVYERLFGTAAVEVDGGWTVRRDRVELVVMAAAAFAQQFGVPTPAPGVRGYRLGCDDPARTRRWFAERGIACEAVRGAAGFVLPCVATHGNVVHVA